jgi:hypothetical protein
MQAYRLITKISKEGTIQLTENSALFGQEVELIILPKSKKIAEDNDNIKKKMTPLEFVNKWAGFLKHIDDEQIDNAKYNYLMNKHK